jgi:hypothetical protein
VTWQTLDRPWQDTNVEYCDVCGNLLIRRYWEFKTYEGQVLRACREDDEDLYNRLKKWRNAASHAVQNHEDDPNANSSIKPGGTRRSSGR